MIKVSLRSHGDNEIINSDYWLVHVVFLVFTVLAVPFLLVMLIGVFVRLEIPSAEELRLILLLAACLAAIWLKFEVVK